MTMKPLTSKVEKELTFELTEKEQAKYGIEAATAEEEARALEAELAQFNTEKKAKIAGLYERSSELLKTLKRGKEERVVECDEVRDYDKGEMRWVLKGKTMASRPLTEQERQVKLEFDEKKRKRHQKGLALVTGALTGKKKTKEEVQKQDLQDVIRQETSGKTKTDMVTG